MIIIAKNKQLHIDEFIFKCCIGKKGSTNFKKEGDNKTPKGIFNLGPLFYRKDRLKKPKTKLKCIPIKKNWGWGNNPNDKSNYNKLIVEMKTKKGEKLFRKDHKYDLLIPIKYNISKKVMGKGSAIFMHLSKNYQATAGCVALSRKDFLIILKILNKNSKIKIY